MHHERHYSLGIMSVGNILKTSAARFGDREALYCVGTGRRFTFIDLNRRSNQLAHALIALGLKPGAVIAFICSNRAEILDIYVALAKAGLVGLPLNYRLAPAEMCALVDAMGATALICEARFAENLQHLKAHCAGLGHVLWMGTDAPPGCHGYEEMLSRAATTEPEVEVDQHAPYYFNLTSGTTGLPKSYILTQFSTCALHSALLSQDARGDDVYLTLFPAFGRVGIGSLLMSIVTGARNVLVNFDPQATLRLIQQEQVTFTWLVPTMAALILAVPDLNDYNRGSLRAVGFVGAMLPESIRVQTAVQLCPRIYEGYGLQEMGMLTVSRPEDRERKPESVGTPVLFCEVRIVDSQGRTLPTGETGEIICRSPNGIRAYHQSPAKNAEAFRDGWFHTGDLGRLDEDGFLFICGRVKDMIITGGQNVHSAEVEATILDAPGVAECAVIGLPHEIWGEVVTAVIVAGRQAPVDSQQIQDFCRRTLAGFKVPRLVVIQDDPLPRTPTGKVQKFLLVQRYSAPAAAPASHGPKQ